MKNIIEFLEGRDLIYQSTDLEKIKNCGEGKTVYAGFDPTASSLHIGNLVSIMLLRFFQQHKVTPIVLIGGATAKIGDPSGRDSVRSMLTDEKIDANKENIKKIISKFLRVEGENAAIFVDNEEWLGGLKYLGFLRDVGKHFSVNQMLKYESVKSRLEREQNLSFLEFNYMILQAYDFTVLKKKYDCILQVGGSDQWGNMINGVELNRKLQPKEDDLSVLTTPLLTNSDGSKMGKSVGGAIWLDEKLLSPYDYFQYFRNISDDMVGKLLRFLSDLPLERILELEKFEGQEINKAKEILAYEITKICHGETDAKKALETAKDLFENNKTGGDLPVLEISKQELEEGIAFSLLIAKTGIVATRGEAKRIVLGGGGRINDIANKDPLYLVSVEDFADGEEVKISAGKKKHAIVRVV